MSKTTEVPAPGGAAVALEAEAGKYLTFRLREETYGLGILQVQEIIGTMKVTQIPKTPGFIRGVINLRGKVIPVVDLRLKFAMESQEDTERTCIIVVQVSGSDGGKIMGMLVDEVSEVLDVAAEQIEPPPSFGVRAQTDFLLGLGKVDGKVIMLLDVDRVLTADEVQLLDGVLEHG